MKHPPQEQDIVPGRYIAGVGMGVIIATLIGTWVAYAIGDCSTRDMEAGATERSARRTVADYHAVERTPFATEAQGTELHLRAEAFLASYGWVDRDQEIIHVPIEVAVELYLARQRGQR